MNLLKPLILEECTTVGLNLVPTKKFFKPVIIISSPLSRESAELLKVDHLFDRAGNPVHFEGSYKPGGELSGAEITFRSLHSGEVLVKTEKVAHVSCYLVEKKGLSVQFRAHLPDADDTKERLSELLDFLSQINKDKFTVQVNDRQGSLVPIMATGPLSTRDAQTMDFSILIGKRTAIVGSVFVKPLDSHFISGWEAKGSGLKSQPAGGRALDADSLLHDTEAAALRAAVEGLLWWAKEDHHDGSPKEIRAIGDLVDWCMNTVPALRPEASNAK